MIGIGAAAPTFVASFVASLVEFVEALTIVLAVGTVRGWKPALLGTLLGVLFLSVLVGLCGPSLRVIPLGMLQLAVGVLLLLFGLRWLRKAILRASGVIALHDEAAEFGKTTRELAAQTRVRTGYRDVAAVLTAFKAVVLEGLEVVFIVVATGAAAQALGQAVGGAVAAGVVVILLGLVLHRPLTRIPENTLKLVVGVLLSAFGVFWTGEGLGLHWPGDDWTLLLLIGGFFAAAAASIKTAKTMTAPAVPVLGKTS